MDKKTGLPFPIDYPRKDSPAFLSIQLLSPSHLLRYFFYIIYKNHSDKINCADVAMTSLL